MSARRGASRVLRAIAFVLGGVMLTVASAWIPTLLNPPMISFPGLQLRVDEPAVPVGPWRSVVLSSPEWLRAAGRINIGVRETIGAIEVSDLAFMPDTHGWHYMIAAGWPIYAFHGGGHLLAPSVPQEDLRTPALWVLPASVPTRQNHVAALPIAPCWPGFVIDVAFWGGALAALVHGVPWLRAHWRRRRGCCPQCAHRRRDASPVCPECGFADAAR